MSESQGAPLSDRSAQVRRIAEDCIRRRAAGESLSDEQILAEHPDLAPLLAEELAKLRRIEAARRRASGAPSPPPTAGESFTLDQRSGEVPAGSGRAPEPEARTPPGHIPGYRLVREVGPGGQAVVFEAVQASTGRKVAVKVLREGPFASEGQRTRFEREVQVLAALNHPNIVTIIDRGTTENGGLFLVMEYVEGKSLDHCLADWRRRSDKGAADPSHMLRLFLKILDAVSAAHLRGIVHRDLKPSNIRIDPRGEPRILDFGLARVLSPARVDETTPLPVTLTGQFLGSLPWASPEQVEGLPDKIDIRSDVYSLGVILYQMLTEGHFPYEVVGTMRDVLNNILTAIPTPPSQALEERAAQEVRKAGRRRPRVRRRKAVNGVVEAIVLKALAKSPEDRYQSAGDFARDIANYLSGQPTLAAGTAAVRRQRRARTIRAASVAAGLFICCAVTAGILWHVLGGPRPTLRPGGTPQQPAPEGTGEWVDLLRLVDPAKDQVAGQWEFRGGDLLAHPTTRYTRLSVPVAIEGSYELEVGFVKLPGAYGIEMFLPAGPRAATQMSLSEHRVRIWLSEKDAVAQTPVTGVPVTLVDGREHKVAVKVELQGKEAEIVARVDGRENLRWKGRTSRLGIDSYSFGMPRWECPGLGVCAAEAVFASARLRMLSGQMKALREAPASPPQEPRRPSPPG